MTLLDSGAGTRARATGEQYLPGPTDPITLSTDAGSLAVLSALIEKYGDFFCFSWGSRRCIGEYFSMLEMQFYMAILGRRFRLRPLPGQTADIDPAVNLRMQKNLQMSLQLRDRVETS